MAESSASQQGRGTVKVSEGWHTLEDDGTKVYTKTWKVIVVSCFPSGDFFLALLRFASVQSGSGRP